MSGKVTVALKDRLMGHVQFDTNGGCWLWKGTLSDKGYGKLVVSGRRRLAHRVSYEMFVGPIPAGLHIDHLCRVRCCCNPAHLEPVTLVENIIRGHKFKTHCPSGHPYSPENTKIKFAKGYPFRACITCINWRNRWRGRQSQARTLSCA